MCAAIAANRGFRAFDTYRSSHPTIGRRVLYPAINFSRFTSREIVTLPSRRRSSDYLKGKEGKRRRWGEVRWGEKKIYAATKKAEAGEREARARHTRLSKFRKKRLPFPCAFRVSRLRRRCIAHYLMDGFSLCSADSLTAGPPDCTLRPFSGCTGEPWLVVPEGGTRERGERGGASPGGWSGVEESGARAGGRAVASLHNEQDAGTPRPPFCLHRNPPCLPVGASLARPHPRPFVLSRAATTPSPTPPTPPLINLLFLRITLRRVTLRAASLFETRRNGKNDDTFS